MKSLFEAVPRVLTGAECARMDSAAIWIRTPEQQWAYAASFERTDADASHSAAVVRLTLAVDRGRVGIGCLLADWSAFIDEVIVGPTSTPVDVELLLLDSRSRGALVVRNASGDGASEARILSLECTGFQPEPFGTYSSRLSAPAPVDRWTRFYGETGDTLAERVRARRFDSLETPVVLRWSDGLAVRALPRDQLSRALCVSGTYEPNTLSVLRSLLEPGDVFFDVGANAGVMSLVASRLVGPSGRVYAFEPSPREYARLEDNLALNSTANVVPQQMAIGAAAGRATLRIAAAGFGGLNTLGNAFPYPGVEIERLEEVKVCTLDEFAIRERIARVAVVKLDVEGAEVAAIRGADRVLKEHRPALIVEVFSRSLEANGCSVADLDQVLASSRYRMYSIDQTARLSPILSAAHADEQNIVAIPDERTEAEVR